MNRFRSFLAVTAVWLIAVSYLAVFARRGWIPSDEGFLGHSAERVLAGELPHRDFDTLYTGALSFWHALAFRLLGVRSTSMRWFLLAAGLVFTALVYRVARRAGPPVVAGGMMLFCVAWSLPNYFASMPSWYNLFCASAGLLALLKLIETGRGRFGLAAGLAAGASCLFKSAGLLFVAAVLLFLVYREQEESREEGGAAGPWGRAFSLWVTLGLGAFAVVLICFVAARPGFMDIVHFTVPGLALTGFLLWNEWRAVRAPFAARWRRLWGLALPFLGGVSVPIGLWLALYLARGADLTVFLDGRLFLSRQRVEVVSFPLPPPVSLLFALPLAGLWGLSFWRRRSVAIDRRVVWPAALGLALLLSFGSQFYVYQVVWAGLRPLVPILAFVGAVTLARRGEAMSGATRQRLFLVLATATLASLIQFPYTWGIYFVYVAPLVALAALFLWRAQDEAERLAQPPGEAPRRLHLAFAAFYFLFALVWLHHGRVQVLGGAFQVRVTDTRLELDRGGLWVEPDRAALYEELVREIRARTAEGDFIYATPDCPEVYFLSGRRNPTSTLSDFFDDDYGRPERTERLLALLDEHRVDLVVLHWNPSFSELPRDLAVAVFERFPERLPLPPLFTLHWREREAGEADARQSGAPGSMEDRTKHLGPAGLF